MLAIGLTNRNAPWVELDVLIFWVSVYTQYTTEALFRSRAWWVVRCWMVSVREEGMSEHDCVPTVLKDLRA